MDPLWSVYERICVSRVHYISIFFITNNKKQLYKQDQLYVIEKLIFALIDINK